jgi:transcriptional regulator with XRE-family HTH domain
LLRFKLWRLQCALTQEEAAARLGLGLSTLSLLESGRLQPTRGQVKLLRRSFGPEADTLFDHVQERVFGDEADVMLAPFDPARGESRR